MAVPRTSKLVDAKNKLQCNMFNTLLTTSTSQSGSMLERNRFAYVHFASLHLNLGKSYFLWNCDWPAFANIFAARQKHAHIQFALNAIRNFFGEGYMVFLASLAAAMFCMGFIEVQFESLNCLYLYSWL